MHRRDRLNDVSLNWLNAIAYRARNSRTCNANSPGCNNKRPLSAERRVAVATTVSFAGRSAIAVVVLLVLGGCNAIQPPSSAPEVEVVAPGVEVRARDLGAGEPPAPDLRFISRLYSLNASGPASSQATITVQLSPPVAQSDAVVVVTRASSAAPWEYLPAVVAPNRTSVSFATVHMNDFGVLAYDLGRAVELFQRDFLDALSDLETEEAGKPACDNEESARGDGYGATSDSGSILLWCLGRDATGRRVLKVTNHRGYPLLASHQGMDLIESGVDWVRWSALSRIAAGDKAILAPGGTIVFDADLAPGGSARIATGSDPVAHSLYALEASITALAKVLVRFGAASGVQAVEITDKVLVGQSCPATLGKAVDAMIAGCLDQKTIVDVFGSKGLLLTPITAAEPVVDFLTRQWNAIVERFKGSSNYHVEVTRAKPAVDLTVFVGQWTGHTRSLTITPDGRAKEHVGDGCCHPIIDLEFSVSAPRGIPAAATATITVTSVAVHDWPMTQPAPRVGQAATIGLANGVITEPLAGGTYCDHAASMAGICGA
ncbi:hypothetical protein ABZ345_44425 [Lentzea sp. NPDC005914]|uniref:hypothetical protein n=1 Tax=Lentzea sp. NPDC005914 TaxID=3154572 RepID=UPI0033F12A8F